MNIRNDEYRRLRLASQPLQCPSSLNEIDDDHHNGENQEYVNETTHRVRGHQPEQPEHNQNNSDCPQHFRLSTLSVSDYALSKNNPSVYLRKQMARQRAVSNRRYRRAAHKIAIYEGATLVQRIPVRRGGSFYFICEQCRVRSNEERQNESEVSNDLETSAGGLHCAHGGIGSQHSVVGRNQGQD